MAVAVLAVAAVVVAEAAAVAVAAAAAAAGGSSNGGNGGPGKRPLVVIPRLPVQVPVGVPVPYIRRHALPASSAAPAPACRHAPVHDGG